MWTNFMIYLSLGPTAEDLYFSDDTSMVEVSYSISGGGFFPEDNFCIETAFGIGGFGFPSYSGTTRIATISFPMVREAEPFAACITPVVDVPETGCVGLCQVGAGTTYGVFCAGSFSGVCFGTEATAAASSSWGQVKTLFR